MDGRIGIIRKALDKSNLKMFVYYLMLQNLLLISTGHLEMQLVQILV